MRLLHRLFGVRDFAATPPAPSSRSTAATLALPPGTSRVDQALWEFQLGNRAQALWEGLRHEGAAARPDLLERCIANGPLRAVNVRTLLEPAPDTGRSVTPRLHANHVAAGVIAMAAPRASEATRWRELAAAQGVSHVVRVATPEEARHLGLSSFDPGGGRPRGGVLKGGAAAASQRTWDVVAPPGAAVSARDMMDLFDKMAAHPPAPGQSVAFQSPEGDDRSAVFSAGWQLYQAVARAEREHRPFTADDVADVVEGACLGLRFNRASTLIGEPGHVASLLTLGHLLLSRPTHRRGVHFQEGREVRMYRLGDRIRGKEELPPGASEADHLAMARHRATGERLVSSMPAVPAHADTLYAPLKGGRGALRIHQEAVMKPDPRLAVFKAPPLRAAWAGPATLILERPGPDADLAWALACLKHNITAVLDLATDEEQKAEPQGMRKGIHPYGTDAQARFDWRLGPEVELDGTHAHAKVRAMTVSATICGKPEQRDLSQEPLYARGLPGPASERPLELMKVGVPPGHAIAPSQLLGLARLMECHRSNSTPEVVAVQCPAGDTRAAVVAAADAIFTRFQTGRLDAGNLTEAVGAEWAHLCRHYAIDLRDHPEHLTSLLAMGEMLLAGKAPPPRW